MELLESVVSTHVPFVCKAEMIHQFPEASSGACYFFECAAQFRLPADLQGQSWHDVAKDWQTLIAGVVAFFPAFFAAVFVWKQLNEQRIQFLKSQQAASLKARLRLSRNISHISRYLDVCYDRLLSKQFSFEDHTLSDGLLNDILDAGVNSSADNLPFFQKYVQSLQSFSSICAVHADIGGEANLVKCFRLLGEIDALTDRLYPFSRFEVEKIDSSDVSVAEIKERLEHHLRRGKDISGTNLSELLALGCFK